MPYKLKKSSGSLPFLFRDHIHPLRYRGFDLYPNVLDAFTPILGIKKVFFPGKRLFDKFRPMVIGTIYIVKSLLYDSHLCSSSSLQL